MAQSPQTLLEFSENTLSDLERGAISPQEAISACRQYSYLREEFSKQTARITEASLAGETDLTETLQSIIGSLNEKLRGLPSFQSEEADAVLKEKEVRDSAFLRATALRRTKEHTSAVLAPYKERRRAFIHAIVTKYSSSMPEVTDTNLDLTLDRTLISAAESATTAQTKERLAEMMTAGTEELSGVTLSTDQRAQFKQDVVQAISDNQEFATAAIGAHQLEHRLVETIYDNLDLKRPDVVADIVLNASDRRTGEALVRGVKLAKVAEGLEKPGRAVTSSRGFFSQTNARGITKGAQQAAEGLLSLVGEPLREIIIKEKISSTFHQLLSNTQQLTDRLGESFVHTAVFTHVAQNMSRSLSEKPATAQITGVFGDVVSSVFRGPLDSALSGAANERLLEYLELSRASANAPKGHAFLPDGAPVWEVFGASYGPKTQSSQKSVFSFFPFFSLAFLGNAAGNLFSSVVDQTAAFIFAGQRIAYELSLSRWAATLPTDIFEDMPLFLSLVIIATILILYILPTPFNVTQLNHATKVAGVFQALFPSNSTSGPAPTPGTSQATLTCADISGTHIFQTDPQWSTVNCQQDQPSIPQCQEKCTIGASGCGSASATMIMNSFGAKTDVITVWHQQHQANGYEYYSNTCASYVDGVLGRIGSAGLSTSGIGIDEVANILHPPNQTGPNPKCGLVLALVEENFGGTPGGHFMVITGIQKTGNNYVVTTLDPERVAGFQESVIGITSNDSEAIKIVASGHDGDIVIEGLWGVVH